MCYIHEARPHVKNWAQIVHLWLRNIGLEDHWIRGRTRAMPGRPPHAPRWSWQTNEATTNLSEDVRGKPGKSYV